MQFEIFTEDFVVVTDNIFGCLVESLAAMHVDSKDKEIIFLCDTVDQLKMQVFILQTYPTSNTKNTNLF